MKGIWEEAEQGVEWVWLWAEGWTADGEESLGLASEV